MLNLQQFTGSDQRYRHALKRTVIYTEGVKHLAEEAGAYWLIDAIASYFGSSKMRAAQKKDDRLQDMQFWNLKLNGNGGATLTLVPDSGEDPVITQEIEFTDFPLDDITIWAGYDGECWTLYLPSEH